MSAYTKATDQETEKKGLLNRLNHLSLRNKIIGIVLVIVLLLIIVSIPSDRNQLIVRQERVDAAQIAYDLAIPAVGQTMVGVSAFIDETGLDLSDNRAYTGLASAVTVFNRVNSTLASRFQGVVTFSTNIHSLLDGNNAVPELDTTEFRTVVTDMDTSLSVGLLALMELNDATDEYNGYHTWISATLAGALFGLPQSYADPVPSSSRLSRTSLNQ